MMNPSLAGESATSGETLMAVNNGIMEHLEYEPDTLSLNLLLDIEKGDLEFVTSTDF